MRRLDASFRWLARYQQSAWGAVRTARCICGVLMMLTMTTSSVGQLPDVTIRLHHGRPTVFVAGQPRALSGYCNFGIEDLNDAMAFFVSADTELYYLQVAQRRDDRSGSRFWQGDRIGPVPMQPEGERLWDLDQQAEFILSRKPDALFIIRFQIRPPESWHAKHLDTCFVTEDGERHDTPSLASDDYWDAASRFSAAVVQYCESQPWARHVIGYANFHHTEGIHEPVGDGWYFDHSKPMERAYLDFLRKKYASDHALQRAYDNPKLTLSNATVPRDRLRGSANAVGQLPTFQCGPENIHLVDYLTCTRDLFHRRFRQLGTAMAGASKRQVIFLHDALKQVMMGWNLKGFFNYAGFGGDISWSFAFPDLLAGSGHINVAALSDADGYDGLITPYDYQARGLGGVYEPEGIADSIVLRGKYFVSEMDGRFHESRGIGAARNPREAEIQMWRNLAASLTRGFNSYYCWGFAVEDWFYSERMKTMIRRQNDVMAQSLNWPHETVPGIAMILDDAAILDSNGAGNFFNEAIMWEQKMGLARCGVPYRIYLLEDLELEQFPEHRVFYFPNLLRMTDARLDLLRNKVMRDGNIVIWGPATGLSNGNSIDKQHAEQMTGFKFEMFPTNSPRRVLLSDFTHPLTEGLAADTVIGGPLAYGPVLLPTDGIDLGTAWVKGGMNHVGLAYKEFGKGAGKNGEVRGEGDYGAVFTAAVQLPAAFWRNVARHAGAHIYCESNDVLMASGSVVALHSLKAGKKAIHLPGLQRVTDMINGREIAPATSTIEFVFEGPDTRVFHLAPATETQ